MDVAGELTGVGVEKPDTTPDTTGAGMAWPIGLPMEVSGDLPRCPKCGKPLDDGSCSRCARQAAAPGADLKVLKGDLGASGSASDVRLVRQVKIPTVDALAGGNDAVDRLPGKVTAMVAALDSGDLVAADRLIDEAMGSLLEGPGYRHIRFRRRLLTVVLWIWCGILVLLGVLAWWLR